MEKHEQIQSFYLEAPGGAGAMSVKRLRPVPDDATHIELVVLAGGPVFLFDGQIDGAQAYRRTRGKDETDFVIGASGTSKATLGIHARYGATTVASDVETIGYMRAYRGAN